MIQTCTLPYQAVYQKIWHESRTGSYSSYIRGKRCQSDDEFFNEISASFQFPSYFGQNWNALNDCLRDLDWLCFKKIFIVIDDYSMVYQGDAEGRSLLIKSLEMMVNYWKKEKIEVEIWLNN